MLQSESYCFCHATHFSLVDRVGLKLKNECMYWLTLYCALLYTQHHAAWLAGWSKTLCLKTVCNCHKVKIFYVCRHVAEFFPVRWICNIQYCICHFLFTCFRGDKAQHLSLLARTADSISQGDLVDRLVRTRGSWNLLPIQVHIWKLIFLTTSHTLPPPHSLPLSLSAPHGLRSYSRKEWFDRGEGIVGPDRSN